MAAEGALECVCACVGGGRRCEWGVLCSGDIHISQHFGPVFSLTPQHQHFDVASVSAWGGGGGRGDLRSGVWVGGVAAL